MAANRESDGSMNTIIGKGTKVEGKMDVASSLRIDGKFSGTLKATDSIIVGTTGELDDVQVNVKNAIVGGKIKGNVIASNKITLESTSNLEGDLVTKYLVIEEGAVFNGHSSSGDQASSRSPQFGRKPDAADTDQKNNG